MLLMEANKTIYKDLKEDLENKKLSNLDLYPKTVEECKTLLNNVHVPPARAKPAAAPTEDVAFAQEGDEKEKGGPGIKTNSAGQSGCFHCGSDDHLVSDCPKLTAEQRAQFIEDRRRAGAKKSGATHAQFAVAAEHGVTMHAAEREAAASNSVLLDNCSTMHTFCDEGQLEDARQVGTTLHAHCNAGDTIPDVAYG